MSKANTDKQYSFEQAIDRLEDIVEAIESGEVGLEAALEQYEQGQALITRCRGILDKAESRIAELTQGPDGTPVIDNPDPLSDPAPDQAPDQATDDEPDASEDPA